MPASITGSRHQGGSTFWAMLWRHVKEAVPYLLGCKTNLISNLICFYWINATTTTVMKKTHLQPALFFGNTVFAHTSLQSSSLCTLSVSLAVHKKRKGEQGQRLITQGFPERQVSVAKQVLQNKKKHFLVLYIKDSELSTLGMDICWVMLY